MSEKATIADRIAECEKTLAVTEAALAHLRAIARLFPDAEDRGVWRDHDRWAARSAHDQATHYDPIAKSIYLEIEGGRVYSTRPVDAREAFDVFQSSGYTGTLIDALRSTTEGEEARRAEQDARAEADAAAKITAGRLGFENKLSPAS